MDRHLRDGPVRVVISETAIRETVGKRSVRIFTVVYLLNLVACLQMDRQARYGPARGYLGDLTQPAQQVAHAQWTRSGQ